MNLQRITVSKLNKYAKKNQIWCVGCGKKLNELLENYEEEPFLKKITVLIDNNKNLWGVKKTVGGKLVVIEGKDRIKDITDEKIILLITSDNYESVYCSVKDLIKGKKVSCYLYPKFYSEITDLLVLFMKNLPLKRQLLFYAGSEPHDNANEIVRYLNDSYSGRAYKIIYLTDGQREAAQKEITYLNKWTIRKKSTFIELFNYVYQYSRSTCLFYENEALDKVNRRQKLFFLNHGTVPLKKVNDVLTQPKVLDYATCPGEGCAELYKTQYGIDYDKQIYMMPARVSRMLKCEGRLRELSKNDTGQMILWLPTFRQLSGSDRRDSDNINAVDILVRNFEEICEVLEKNNQTLVIKKHPREKNCICFEKACSNILVIDEETLKDNKMSLQELMKDADALITDYSGIAFEYMLFDRPIGYVLSDYEQYFRGFAVDNPFDYMPGIKILDSCGFVSFLESVYKKADEYSAARRTLVKKLFGKYAYINGAEELIKFIDGENGWKKKSELH